jgi:hypothetical protein
MTQQEIFDIVARHLLTQNAKAHRGDKCVYRAEDGKKCAIGCLIPDDVYSPDMEGQSILSLLESDVWTKKLPFSLDDAEFLGYLQAIHDWHDLSVWKDKLQEIATKYQLNDSVLKGF